MKHWGVKQRDLAYLELKQEAEAIVGIYFPRMKAAAEGESFDEVFEQVKKELKCQVRPKYDIQHIRYLTLCRLDMGVNNSI